ncbi:MAG: AAA family ATPase, partial [Acidimicrobiia bacterium]
MNEQPKRRKTPFFDRVKILVLLGVVIGFLVWAKVNAPFVSVSEAFAEFAEGVAGRILLALFGLEVLRQVHYLIAERWSRYHLFWQENVFQGTERRLQERVKEFTRYRIRRVFRVLFYILVFALIRTSLDSNIDSPVEAILRAPEVILNVARNPEFLRFLLLPLVLVAQFVFLFWFLSRGGIDIVYPDDIETRFTKVWGQDHVLDLVKENIAFLEKPDEIEAKGGYIPGGILLWGPPGTGKTLMAEGIAGEVGKPFVFVDPGAFIQMFFGVGILKVKRLFRKLRKLSIKHGGVVVFFDEADALGSRGAVATGSGPGQPYEPLPVPACNALSYMPPATQRQLLQPYLAGEIEPMRWVRDPDTPPRGLVQRIIMGG